MQGNELAKAFVRLSVDDTGFAGELHSEVDAATRDLKATVPIAADTKLATAKVDELKGRILKLTTGVATATLGLNDKDAKSKALAMQAYLLRLDRTVSKPEVTLEGGLVVESKLDAIEHRLGRINGMTATAHVDVKDRTGLLSKLTGLFGGGGGGGIKGLFGLGGSAAGSAGSAAGGASQAGGPGGTAALYGAAGLGAAALAPAAIPTVLGLGLGGLGAYLSAGPQIAKSFSAAFAIIKRDVAPLRPLFVSVFAFLPGLAKSIGPALRDVFATSVPFLKTFLGLLAPIARILLPAFSRVLREMTPSLPLISQGILAVVRGFAGMLAALGPRGMQNSAKIFVGLCKLMGLSLIVVGKIINATAVFLVWLGNKIIQRAADWRKTFDDFRHRTAVIFDGVRHDIAHIWDSIFNDTIGTVIRFVTTIHKDVADFRHAVANVFDGLRHDVAAAWDAMWNHLQNAARDGWSWIVGHVWDPVRNLVTRTLPGWFHTAVSAVGSAWNAIKNVVKTPINWVIRYVLDDGLIKAFDVISGAVGGPHINPIKTLATGGRLAGYGGGDVVPALLEPGEAVVDKQRTRRYAGLLGLMGVPGFAGGGQVPPAESRFGTSTQPKPGSAPGIFGKIDALARLSIAAATGNTTALTNAFKTFMPGGTGGAVGDLAKLLVDIPATLVHDAVRWVFSHFTGGGSGAGGGHVVAAGAGVQRWAPDVLRVLGMLGLPSSDLGTILAQMTTESGGNPNAQNNTDSNAAAGDPSRGLMQTIMSTFLAYAGPFRGRGIFDPLANIYAGVNYAISRYGRTGFLSVLGHGHGYSGGGLVSPRGGVSVFDGGGWIREPVMGIGQSGRRYAFAANGQAEYVSPGGRGGGAALHVEHLHVADRTQVELLAQRVSALIQAPSFSTTGGF